jgi:predicted 2-oxoglutarate/Fe(II)-dependent dioxygenase YbiX
MCEEMIRIAEEHGGWNPMPGDKFPAREIRVKELGLWAAMEEHWQRVLYPVIEKHWYPTEMYGLRDAFVMRYSLDTQTSLRLHTDASLVTGSVKLNDDYLGADLIFPRQNVTNRDIPVGKCILFPGQVTHGHECTELTYGTKYSLTMWSSRMRGDVN